MDMQHTKRRNAVHKWIAGSTFAAIVAAPIHAQETPAASTMNSGEEIIVTGTRRTGMAAADSPAPIQLLDTGTLAKVGQPDLMQALAQNVPSFSAQPLGSDAGTLTLAAKLRGLSPNHALVLINGKRRHTSGNLVVLNGPYQGGAAADLSFIPVAAIERIEVLQDGAAAQYGTDAIAGVLNIILKDNDTGGSVGANSGAYIDGGGDTYDVAGNIGLGAGDGAFLNLTTEMKYHDYSERGGIDPRVVNPANLALMPQMRNVPGYPKLNRIQGDARIRLNLLTFNAGMKVGESAQLYSFGSYGRKHAQAFANYRLPNRIPALYPLGFNPQQESKEQDYGMTVGIKGTAFGDWRWDLATTYGKDDFEINTIRSGNVSLYNDRGFTPADFHAGDFIATQWTTNLDFSREFDMGMAEPLNLAFGLERREETYEIKAGDEFSRYKEGSQSFPGFALTDAGKHDRDNVAVYVDVAFSPVDKLQLDVAARYEDFSDFGDTSVGKLTGRYDLTKQFALRGTISTGFRAPTLAEEHYSATNVQPATAFVQLSPNSRAAALVGVQPLKAEKSTNFSLGLVMRSGSGITTTLDAYQIEIDDRVVGSGFLFGVLDGRVVSPAVNAAIAANGNVLDPDVATTGINVFSNGLDTRTQGAELVVAFDTAFDNLGTIDWSIAANYNHTKVTRIKEPPAQLAPQSLFNKRAISELETAFPEYRLVLGATWNLDKFSATLRETVYGESSAYENRDSTHFYKNTIGVTPITDLELAYQFTDRLKLSVGANNLFNEYPDQKNPELLKDYRDNLDNAGVAIYPAFSSFGINGGYYYGKIGYSF
jgi:iron complex outermembrane recepter protein